MWIETLKPHMWDDGLRFPLDVGAVSVIGTNLPVERIGVTYPQVIHKKCTFSPQSTYWRITRTLPIYGGRHFRIFRTIVRLLHMKGLLSTDNRELSTKPLSRQGFRAGRIPQMWSPFSTILEETNLINPQIWVRGHLKPALDC